MTTKELFELIRTQETILWIGAGFSRYAGYPTGRELHDILIASLDGNERHQFEKIVSLKDCAEYFTVLKGRDRLEQILVQTFSKSPTDTYFHDLLSHISHFKTIITTNYDQLVEKSFTKKGIAIRNSSDINNYIIGQTKIFKVHGDLTIPKEMIITATDYSRMHNRLPKDPFWSTIIGEIASKHIIFLGYGYEDENIWSDFDAVYNQIGPSTKRRFMVAPNFDSLKRARLTQQNIELIEMNAENFLQELIEDLKKHIVGDLERKLVSSQIAVDFINSFDMAVKLDIDSEQTRLISLQKRTGLTNSKLEFSTIDKDLIKEYKTVLNGDGALKIDIPAERLTEFKHLVEGFQLLGIDTLEKLSLHLNPSYTNLCRILFPEKNIQTKELRFDVYAFKNHKLRIVSKLNEFDINIHINFSVRDKIDIKLNLIEPEKFTSIKQYREAYQFFSLITNGSPMHIKLKKDRKVIKQNLVNSSMALELDHYFQIYTALSKIEDNFKVKFKNARPQHMTIDVIEKINKLTSLINKGYYATKSEEGLKILINEELQNAIKRPFPAGMMFMLDGQPKHIELLGSKLILGGEQIILQHPMEIITIKENEMIAIKDKENTIVYKYERFGLQRVNKPDIIWQPN